MLHTPALPREEYNDNEKYELKHWNLDEPSSLRPLVGQINRIRRENLALQRNESIRFHNVQQSYQENQQLLAYSKRTADGTNTVLVIVNLDPVNTQAGWVQLPLAEYGLPLDGPFQVSDLLTGSSYTWSREWNYVALDPAISPVHIFRIERPRLGAYR